MSISLLHASPELRIGAFESLFVTVWNDSSTLESMEAMARHQQAQVDAYGQLSLLLVFTGTPKTAAPGVKERGDELARRFKDNVRTNVVLVQSRGFSAIVVRTFLAGFSLMSPIPMSSATSIDDAVKLLQSAPGQTAALRGNVHLAEHLAAFIEGR